MIVHKTQIANRGRLSNGQVTVAGWRHLLLISALDAFRDFQSANISETVRVG
jgi:hypothetical protein